MPWRSTPAAPACQFARDGDGVLVRWRYTGVEHALTMPAPDWDGLAATATTRQQTAGPDGEWIYWGPTGAAVRRPEGHVTVAAGGTMLILPASIWEQIVAAARAGVLPAAASARTGS